MTPNALLLINSVLLALTFPLALSVLLHLVNHSSSNYHIRYALILAFSLISVTTFLSLYINYSIYFLGILSSDLFQVANVRNLIKNTALFTIALTFYLEKQ